MVVNHRRFKNYQLKAQKSLRDLLETKYTGGKSVTDGYLNNPERGVSGGDATELHQSHYRREQLHLGRRVWMLKEQRREEIRWWLTENSGEGEERRELLSLSRFQSIMHVSIYI